jgi:hypothetical protein
MLVVSTWWWGNKFPIDNVNKLAAGVKRHLKRPYRFACIHDKGFPAFSDDVHHSWPIPDENLTKVQGCFARLRMFDPTWQQAYPFHSMYDDAPSDCIVNIDLDTVITGPLDPLFNRNEPFIIMQGANAVNPCPMNGALMMLHAGVHSEVWNDFSLEAAQQVPFHSFPDDQGWIWHKVPDAAGWRVGPEYGIYVYQKRGWPMGTNKFPKDARLVTFVNRDPSQLVHLDWVRENWKL